MEAERPIEKLLRSYAGKRRQEAGAPLELRPEVRRRLQDEVARRFGEKGEKEGAMPAFWLRLASLRTRLAWGLAALALLGVAVALLVPGVNRSKTPRMLARSSRVSRAPAPAQAPSLQRPAASVAGPPAARQTELSKSSGELLADKGLKVPPATQAQAREPAQEAKPSDGAQGPASVSAPVPGEALAEQFDHSAGAVAASSPGNTPLAVAAAPQGSSALARAAAVAPAPAGAEADRFKNNQVESAAFARRYGPAPGSSARSFSNAGREPAGVSGNFEKEVVKDIPFVQRFVRVVPKALALRASDRVSDRAAPSDPVLAAFQVEQSGRRFVVTDSDGSVYTGYLQLTNFFQVIGTNRSLKQKVVFSGNLIKPTDSPEAPGTRISGKAVVGERREIQMEAVLRKP
ncbi:MAG: hypothetical protein ACLQM8_22825 [Limisphaerales bacterium]